MSQRYSIDGQILTDIADAIRGQAGETKPAIGGAIYDYSYTNTTTATSYTTTFTVPGASSVIVKNIDTLRAANNNRCDAKVAPGTQYAGYVWSSIPNDYLIKRSQMPYTDELVFENTDTITFAAGQETDGSMYYTYLTIYATVIGLDENGEILMNKAIQVPRVMTPEQMAEEINNMANIPEKAYNVSGNCSYRFAYNNLNWLLEKCGDKMSMKNITAASRMFTESTNLTDIPVDEIGLKNSPSIDEMFYQCTKLKKIPRITGLTGTSLTKAFYGLYLIEDLNDTQIDSYGSTLPISECFRSCFRLRTIGNFFEKAPNAIPGNSIYGFYEAFSGCYSLDELINLPFVYSTYNSSYSFGSCFSSCSRLKNLTFKGGSITASNYKGSELSLTLCIGYFLNDSYVKQYTTFTEETRVTDDASYQALKDNPDYWTTDVAYSRYNHDSAVATINSLPDCSSLTVKNTIKFNGASGSKTDGGAINTLTAEEIAVATAKGWTVTLV